MVQDTEERFVVFRLGEHEYGVPIMDVHTVERVTPITRVPRSPEYVMGIINLRGEVVPVINLRRRLGLPDREIDEKTHIVVVWIDGENVGMLVDELSQVLPIPSSQIEEAKDIIGNVENPYLRGVGRADDRMITLLDLRRVFGLEATA
jgi:purine-binding chemotaxis protein CheW